jgi:hypothetical protein
MNTRPDRPDELHADKALIHQENFVNSTRQRRNRQVLAVTKTGALLPSSIG